MTSILHMYRKSQHQTHNFRLQQVSSIPGFLPPFLLVPDICNSSSEPSIKHRTQTVNLVKRSSHVSVCLSPRVSTRKRIQSSSLEATRTIRLPVAVHIKDAGIRASTSRTGHR
jgi:hypothetical protein